MATAYTFPNTVTLTLSVAGRDGTVAVTRDGTGRMRFSDGVKNVDFHGEQGFERLFETLNGLTVSA